MDSNESKAERLRLIPIALNEPRASKKERNDLKILIGLALCEAAMNPLDAVEVLREVIADIEGDIKDSSN